MIHALRKTEGPFGAGTRVTVRSRNSDGTVTVEVLVPNPDDRHTSYDYEDMTFDINEDDIVELRPKNDVVPLKPRAERREFLRNLFSGTKPSREDVK